jgi:hypothetical protein
MQMMTLMKCLDTMAYSRRHDLPHDDPMLLAGKLTSDMFEYTDVESERASAWYVNSASIGWAAYTVRTQAGTVARNRTTVENWAYVPFHRHRQPCHCILNIQQLLLVRAEGMGWEQDRAKIVTGTLHEARVLAGPGCVQQYNDDADIGALQLPTLLRANPANGYLWAVHVHQIACPVVVTQLTEEIVDCATIQKTGFHG